jgi:predicted XRE-type DNA-binding protein
VLLCLTGRTMDEKALARFWKNVNKTETCWLWTGYLYDKKDGYGRFFCDGMRLLAHRASWLIEYGHLPEKNVLHTCDVPLCVNPAHLFLGDQEDNMIDARRKGRIKTKITQADADQIRQLAADGIMQKDIAEAYGISRANVCLIVGGKIWTQK